MDQASSASVPAFTLRLFDQYSQQLEDFLPVFQKLKTMISTSATKSFLSIDLQQHHHTPGNRAESTYLSDIISAAIRRT